MSVFRRVGVFVLFAALLGAAGCTGDVTIGAIISESGGLAPYGRQVRRGLELALEEINAAGGFKGGKINVVFRDDASRAEVGEKAVRELIDQEGAGIVIGAISSPVTLAIAPICQSEEVLLLSPSSSAPKITDAGDYIFRNYPSDVLEGTAMADFARGLGLRRVVIFALDNDFGEGLEDVFTSRFENRSREIAKTFRVQPFDDANGGKPETLDAMVDEVKGLHPDGIYVIGYEREMVALLERLDAAAIEAVVLATSSVTPDVWTQAAGAAEMLVFPQPAFDVNSQDEAVASFVSAFRAKYSRDPDLYAAHGYDALKLLVQAMVDTGASRTDEVRRGLLGLENFQGAAGRTSFDERGDVVRYPKLFVIQDGQPVPFETFEQQGGELPIPG